MFFLFGPQAATFWLSCWPENLVINRESRNLTLMHFRNICNTPFLTLDGAIRPRLIWYMNLAKDTLVIDLQRASALDRHLRYVKACLAAISEKLPLIRSLEIVGSPNDWYEFCHFTQIFDEYKLDWDRARGLEKIRGVIKVSRLRELLNQYDHPPWEKSLSGGGNLGGGTNNPSFAMAKHSEWFLPKQSTSRHGAWYCSSSLALYRESTRISLRKLAKNAPACGRRWGLESFGILV